MREDVLAFDYGEKHEISENHSLYFTWDISVSHNENRILSYN